MGLSGIALLFPLLGLAELICILLWIIVGVRRSKLDLNRAEYWIYWLAPIAPPLAYFLQSSVDGFALPYLVKYFGSEALYLHQDLLWIPGEVGVVGIVLFGGASVFIFVREFRKKTDGNPIRSILILPMLLGVVFPVIAGAIMVCALSELAHVGG